jgi:hypothetical protein
MSSGMGSPGSISSRDSSCAPFIRRTVCVVIHLALRDRTPVSRRSGRLEYRLVPYHPPIAGINVASPRSQRWCFKSRNNHTALAASHQDRRDSNGPINRSRRVPLPTARPLFEQHYSLKTPMWRRFCCVNAGRLMGLNHVSISGAISANVNVGSCTTSEKRVYEKDGLLKPAFIDRLL